MESLFARAQNAGAHDADERHKHKRACVEIDLVSSDLEYSKKAKEKENEKPRNPVSIARSEIVK